MSWLCPILIVAAIAWVVIGLIRSFTGAGRGGYGPGYGGQPMAGGPQPIRQQAAGGCRLPIPPAAWAHRSTS